MADEHPGADQEQQLSSLVEQTSELARRLPGSVRRLSVRAGDHAVEIEWDPGAAGPPGATAPATGHAEAGDEGEAASADHHVVTAPLVGVFYSAPEPGAAPFVEEGAVVETGQQVGIIEAMKIMNGIQTERGGRVTRILVTSGEVVEFGQDLMVIEPYEGG